MCTKFGGLGIGSFRLILGRDIDTDRQTDMQQADRHYLEPNATELTVFRLDALALSVIATATWLGGWLAGWVAGCHTPVLYQNG